MDIKSPLEFLFNQLIKNHSERAAAFAAQAGVTWSVWQWGSRGAMEGGMWGVG